MSYTALFFVWFAATVAQVYIAQFLKYLGAPAWLNQPLIQLPLFRYIPSRLENPLGPLAVAALVALAAGLIRSVYLKVSRRSKHNRLATALPAAATTER